MKLSFIVLAFFLACGSLCLAEDGEKSYTVASVNKSSKGFWSRLSGRSSLETSIIDPELMVRYQPLGLGEFAQQGLQREKANALSIGELSVQPAYIFFENDSRGWAENIAL